MRTDAPPRVYRVPPPAPEQLVRWPASFGTRFTVFCDVEEEFDWRAPLSRAHRSTTAMAGFAEGHCRFADCGVGLACMVTHPVATDPAAVATLARVAEDGRSTIGAQLHAWVTPPFAETDEPADSYVGNLPPALEAAKLDALTAAIEEAFGKRPWSFRSGRYGIGSHSHALLASRGYRLDCSVRARYDYGDDGGPDFTAIGSHVYRSQGLIELPSTTIFTGRLRAGGAGLHRLLGRVPRARGLFARAGLLSRVSLTPEDMPIADALEAVNVAVGEGVRLLTLSFHSPSLVPGHTPYVRDAADLRRFHGWWSAMFDRLERLGVSYASLDEVIAAASG